MDEPIISRTLRIPKWLNERIVKIAAKEKRSINAQIMIWIEENVKDKGTADGERSTDVAVR